MHSSLYWGLVHWIRVCTVHCSIVHGSLARWSVVNNRILYYAHILIGQSSNGNFCVLAIFLHNVSQVHLPYSIYNTYETPATKNNLIWRVIANRMCLKKEVINGCYKFCERPKKLLI